MTEVPHVNRTGTAGEQGTEWSLLKKEQTIYAAAALRSTGMSKSLFWLASKGDYSLASLGNSVYSRQSLN